MKTLSTLSTIALLAAVQPAFGVVVFDNGGPNQQAGNEAAAWIQTEDFKLASPSTIGSAEFWTLESGSWDGTLDWWIFADSAGLPGTILTSGSAGAGATKIATGGSLGSFTEYKYDFSLAGVPTLADGTTYWFGIHLSGNWDRDEIYWETTDPTAGNGTESAGGTMDNWFDNGQEHAFNLSGAAGVPDAAGTALLLGLGLTLLGAAKRRHLI